MQDMESVAKKKPKRNDNRIILQFDYDCFYAQVYENKYPHLKSKPLGIKQKNILATCNYNARAKGVKKLMLISEAKKLCPDLVIIEGEDLTPFRDMSKKLFNFLKSHSWSERAEKLGFDEVFLDVTDIVEYNILCLNRNSLVNSFFHLSQKDPELGFACDFSAVAGPTIGEPPEGPDSLQNMNYARALVASHLAMHLRTKLESEFGYTSTCGIASNKLLSKLAGGANKPRNQTTILAFTDDDIQSFMDKHTLRKVPGIGFKMAHLLDTHIKMEQQDADSHSFESDVTVRDARLHPNVTAPFLEKLFVGPGAEKGVGPHPTEVKTASEVPSQISIEDTYKGLESIPDITAELFKLSCSLIRRMRVDLLTEDEVAEEPGSTRWIARPKTLRLAIRWWSANGGRQKDFSRVSKSGPLPTFVFETASEIEDLAQKLVTEPLLPMLRRLHAEHKRPWNLQLINICVANMVAGAADDKHGVGRDISVMFRRQDEVLRPWKVTDMPSSESDSESDVEMLIDAANEDSWAETIGQQCRICGQSIPSFAQSAHQRFHETAE